ncbi:MAG: bacteriohemerythrin [Rhodanobacteraceae bacterium]|nr:bacteriohemerythrin [Rhodanobacteraceae bacterium]
MSYITWTSDLDTGVKMVDQQHLQIVEAINRIHEGSEAKLSHSEIGKRVDALVAVAVNHFRDEEKLMQDSGYEYFDIHKGVHERFVAELAKLVGRFKDQLDDTGPILDMMDNWLFMHIRNNDKGYVPSVQSHM